MFALIPRSCGCFEPSGPTKMLRFSRRPSFGSPFDDWAEANDAVVRDKANARAGVPWRRRFRRSNCVDICVYLYAVV
jgi:hypothetical protein